MRPLSLLRTSTFRLAAFYLGLFTLSVGAVLGVVWWFTAGVIERQTEQAILQEVAEIREDYARRGRFGLLQTVSTRSRRQPTDMIYALASSRLDILTGNLAPWPLSGTRAGWTGFEVRDPADPDRKRLILALVMEVEGYGWLLVGQDMTDRYQLREQILAGLFWAVSLALVAGAVGSVIISRRVARRIDGINGTIDRITAGAFADRMPVSGTGDEIDRLSLKLNAMLDEIGRLMLGLRQVTDNVAHDLRTPMARLRARLETTLTDPDLSPPQRGRLEQAVEETDRMLSVFKAILDIAAAESGRARADFTAVDLRDIAADTVELYEPAADDRGLTLDLLADLSPDAVAVVTGSRQLLAQALSNLVENALKYTPTGGRVSIRVEGGGQPRLIVADTGPGVPAAERERVLERFVRLEAHRGTPGHGLGLSLVAAIARLHGAELRLEDNAPGLRVVLVFPSAVE
ncbi:MAG: hypothetical protein RLY86_3013 [Pseudomonadota bacterium]